MPDPSRPAQATNAPVAPNSAAANIAGRITELKVSGNLMTLDTGLFCLFQQPGMAMAPQDGSGLPGVRISIPPRVRAAGTAADGQGEVTIRGLHADGWLGPQDGAALVRVSGAPAQILITVYQSPDHPADTAPRLQVVPLSGPASALAQGGAANQSAPNQNVQAPVATRATTAKVVAGKDIIAHVQRTGDVSVDLGEWLGKPGSGKWIEGFSITPHAKLAADDIEYQAVLGRGWLSPWITGGKFCGSRGMALPMLGFNLRLRGKAADQFTCEYSASFVDGTRIGPLPAGQSCEAPNLSPLEAFQVALRPRAAASPAGKTAMAKKPATKPAPVKSKPAGKAPAAKKPVMPARKRGR